MVVAQLWAYVPSSLPCGGKEDMDKILGLFEPARRVQKEEFDYHA
jgi:hypothetical protein